MSGIEESIRESPGQGFIRAALASAFLFSASASAQNTADTDLKKLSEVPSACSDLAKGGNDVAACRTQFHVRIKDIQDFVVQKKTRELSILNASTPEKERCRQALPVLKQQKEEILDIARFLGAELRGDGSDPVSKILAPETIKEMRKQLGRSPTPDEFASRTEANITKYEGRFARCGLLFRVVISAAFSEGGAAQTTIEADIPAILKLIDEAIDDLKNPERMKRAVLAMVGFLSLLEDAAKGGR